MVGNALILALFGVAALASPAIGRAYQSGQPATVELNDEIYGTPLLVTGVPEVLLYGAGIILLAIAIWRARAFPRWTAVLYAASAPLIGLIGPAYGEVRPLGAVLLIVSALGMALALQRDGRASEHTPALASNTR